MSESLDKRISALEQNGIPGVEDFFATSAMTVLSDWKISTIWTPKQIASYCYDIAEAMMEERSKRNENKKGGEEQHA